jgi:hypothetical protein
MDCRAALEIFDCQRTDPSGVPDGDIAAAESHVAECRRCRAIVKNRRLLDRKIGRTMRSVDVPRGAQERLVARLSALESVAQAGEAPSEERAVAAEPAAAAPASGEGLIRPQRRLPRGLVPVAACVAVAAIGFFTVIWALAPRLTVEDVRQRLAQIDFASLESLRDFEGGQTASRLPTDPAWKKLQWSCRQIAKGLTDGKGHEFAVYGFVLPSRQRHPIRGLLAVIPRGQMRAPPNNSLTDSLPSDYLPSQIGESVSVSWTDGGMVYVCLIEGGEDSLSTLRQMLGESAA